MIYLYGLLDRRASGAAEHLRSIEGVTGPIEVVSHPTCQLICGAFDGQMILPKRRNLLAHARVLEAALTIGTVLPMRFGMSAESRESVQRMLEQQSAAIESEMAQLTGLVELGLRVSYDRDPSLAQQLSRHPELKSEHRRLRAAKPHNQFEQAEFGRRLGEALDRHRTDAQHKLIGALKPYVADLVIRRPNDEAEVLAADLLVDQSQEAGLADVLATLLADLDFGGGSEPSIQIIGPEPPFNFVRVTLPALTEAA
ncbi:MAG: GvpL/GvpF family gas vesicle protein [Pseudomonadota bacterium]